MAKLKFCGHCGGEKLTLERRTDLTRRFEEVHGMGAERFMLDWLKANTAAAGAANALDIDPSDPRIRVLLSLACFRILSAILPPKETKTT